MSNIFEGIGTGWRFAYQPVIIPAGQSLSPVVELESRRLFALQLPANWTTADLSFRSTIDGINWFDVYDEYGAERLVSGGASRIVTLDPGPWLGLASMRIRSGTSALPVAQASSAEILVLGVP